MEHLSPEQLRELKELLLRRRAEVLKRLESFLSDPTLKASGEIGDEVDSADLEMARLTKIRLRERETVYLKKVEYALRKMEEGTYGICENCGRPIAYERLKARPVAVYCIECKTKLEAEGEE
ncbi:MAG: RNA polymerase-binding protein DksA [Aquificae bacterium]|nr:RNA polymerase-binding protein DksA [Aquificota bacterium]